VPEVSFPVKKKGDAFFSCIPIRPVLLGHSRAAGGTMDVVAGHSKTTNIQGEKTMTKAELIDAVKGELTKKQAADLVEAVFCTLKTNLKKDGRFAYPGFGTFAVKNRAARMGKNPKTGAAIKIPASKTVGFKPAAAFKDTL
jgi:DNA-binding protein HU-beta